MVTIYAQGKIFREPAGKPAGDYLPDCGDFDLAVKSAVGLFFAEPNYVLQDGDVLVVVPRGVAG